MARRDSYNKHPMADLSHDNIQQIRLVVREETADMRQDLTRLGVFMENLEHQFKVLGEAVSDTLKFTRQVSSHSERINHLENDNRFMKETVTIHSKQLKSLGAK